jgi:uncharacterized protein YndB with AHSA1/START domain
MTDLILKKEITINASVSKVWEAVSTSEWWDKYFPATKVTSDWKVGSPVLFTGNYQGKDFTDKGTILKFETNKIMQYTYWSGFSGLPDIPENYMIITFELVPEGSAVKLMLTQENFNNETQYKHSDFGWNNIMLTIKEMLEK